MILVAPYGITKREKWTGLRQHSVSEKNHHLLPFHSVALI